MSLFKPDPIKAKIKAITNETNRANAINKIAGELALCDDYICNVINRESLLVEKRREAQLPDHDQKARIHDAIVNILAIEELRFELDSLTSDQALEEATRRLSWIMIRMQCMTPGNISIKPKDLYKQMGLNADDTVEPFIFPSRAELIDEAFVNQLIDGVTLGMSVKPLIKKLLAQPKASAASKESTPVYDFSEPSAQDQSNSDILSEFAKMR